MSVNRGLQPGPCVVCGATNYPPSLGGPNICPSCDCGRPSPVQLRRMREDHQALLRASVRLTAEHATTMKLLSRIGDALPTLRREHCECDDAYYSCPVAVWEVRVEEDNYTPEPPRPRCSCGADEHNAKIDVLLADLAAAQPKTLDSGRNLL